MYNYLESIIEDVKEAIAEYDTKEFCDREEFEERLNDDLFIDDSVTGNASGSYTFNRAEAKNYVEDNLDLLAEACREFGVDDATIGEKFLDEDFEYFDVTIRCYLLGRAIAEALDDMENDLIFADDEEEEEN